MSGYPESELREAFIAYVPDRFDEICAMMNSRNSRSASSVSVARQHA
jgi:hypothetical protein